MSMLKLIVKVVETILIYGLADGLVQKIWK